MLGIYIGFIGNFFSVSKFMKMFHKVAGSQEVLGLQGILVGKHEKGVEQFLKWVYIGIFEGCLWGVFKIFCKSKG